MGYALAWMINERPEAVANQVRDEVHPPRQIPRHRPAFQHPRVLFRLWREGRRCNAASRESAGENRVMEQSCQVFISWQDCCIFYRRIQAIQGE
jgi:hypothetical protein